MVYLELFTDRQLGLALAPKEVRLSPAYQPTPLRPVISDEDDVNADESWDDGVDNAPPTEPPTGEVPSPEERMYLDSDDSDDDSDENDLPF